MSLAACSKDVAIQTSKSEDINFNVVLGKATKATETSKTTLDTSSTGFYVYAFKGEGLANKWFGPVPFKRDTDNRYHPTDGNTYQYPDKTSTLYFYAYYPTITADNWGTGADFSGVTARPRILNVSPNSEITKQQDMIIANNSGNHSTSTVVLNFKHILSQIDIKVKNSNTAYQYVVKGVKINGVFKKASAFIYPVSSTPSLQTLSSTDNYDYTTDGTNAMDYQALDNIGTYTHEYSTNTDDRHVTNSTETSVIAGKTETGIGTFMLLPQDLHPWNVKDAATGAADKTWSDDAYKSYRGAYIAVLLEISHINGSRLTKIFPVEESGTTNTGWVAIPIGQDGAADETWEPGKKYTYTLDFSKGGGWIDPTDPKDPGEEVLGSEILFTVKVDAWDTTSTIDWINS